MKRLLNLILGVFLIIPGIYAQYGYNLSYNRDYCCGEYADKQDYAATEMLYNEINEYRKWNGLTELIISERIVGYACRWGNYMVSQHVSITDKFYEHSKYGPDSLHVPASCAENIHLLYFDHKPSALEIVSGLMYGIVRSPQSVIGWILSEGHNRNLLNKNIGYYGASVYVIETVQSTNKIWAVYGTVNFSISK